MARKTAATLTPKDYRQASPEETKRLVAAAAEAEAVESFVAGRKATNEAARQVRAAQKFFAAAKKKTFVSAKHRVTISDTERMAFDKDAFIRDFGQAIYDRYYKPMPGIEYKVEEI